MYAKAAFICLIAIFGSLSGASSLEKAFKPILDKTEGHSIEQIDFIYMINLDQRPEKFDLSCQEFEPYGIKPYRFSAVNGWELSEKVLCSLGVTYEHGMPTDLLGTAYLIGEEKGAHEIMHVLGRNYYSHHFSRGAIGICLSHLSILQDAYDSGYRTIWVMEDDIEIIRDPHELSDLIPALDRAVGKYNWDILFTDPDTKRRNGEYIPCCGVAKRPNFTPKNPNRFKQRKEINKHFTKVGARYGAYSMIIRRSGMKKLLDFFKTYKLFLPFDMDYCLPNDIHLYSMRYDVVSTKPDALSDNGAPRYQKQKRTAVPAEEFEEPQNGAKGCSPG